jgi:hypothetical protein
LKLKKKAQIKITRLDVLSKWMEEKGYQESKFEEVEW